MWLDPDFHYVGGICFLEKETGFPWENLDTGDAVGCRFLYRSWPERILGSQRVPFTSDPRKLGHRRHGLLKAEQAQTRLNDLKLIRESCFRRQSCHRCESVRWRAERAS